MAKIYTEYKVTDIPYSYGGKPYASIEKISVNLIIEDGDKFYKFMLYNSNTIYSERMLILYSANFDYFNCNGGEILGDGIFVEKGGKFTSFRFENLFSLKCFSADVKLKLINNIDFFQKHNLM